MLIHPTAERLRSLGLSAMADALIELQGMADAAELTREDWLGLLVDREATSRDNKRLSRRLRDAKLRQAAVVEDTDFRTPRGLDRSLFLQLAGCGWLREHSHVVIGGPTGVGKSWLLARWATRRAGRATQCSTSGRPGCLLTLRPPVVKAGCRGCWPRWSARGC